MAAQFDILALEPFYGGARRAMLQTIRRCSRHRWTILKLPPRRIERRLAAGANWFAAQLVRHFSGNIDLLFTSDAMNLASLFRLVPELASKPSVVYFHENHLPEVGSAEHGPFDLVNLNAALLATEIWFNSEYHRQLFFERANALIARHSELGNGNPLAAIGEKASVVPPPMDLSFIEEVRNYRTPTRRPDTIFVETRDASMDLLNSALENLARIRSFHLITVGPIDRLKNDWERTTVREADEVEQALGMLKSRVMLSVKPRATSDYLFVRAMLAGCRPVVPDDGAYPGMIPDSLAEICMCKQQPDAIAEALADALDDFHWEAHPPDWRKSLSQFDAIPASRQVDGRLEQLRETKVGASRD
jgi:hypothetical protein